MASHFKTLIEAKTEYKARTGYAFNSAKVHLYPSMTRIFNRNRGRKGKGLKPLKKPYFVGTYLQWLNL